MFARAIQHVVWQRALYDPDHKHGKTFHCNRYARGDISAVVDKQP